MTTDEHRIAQYQLDVQIAEAKVRHAKVLLDQGFKRASAEFEMSYSALKLDLELEVLKLEKDKADLKWGQAELENGFS